MGASSGPRTTTQSGFQPRNPEFRAVVTEGVRNSAVVQFFGFELAAVEAGHVALTLAHRPCLGHLPGYFQGAIMAAIAEYSGAWSCYTLEPPGWNHIMLDLNIKFLGRAQGTHLIGRGRVLAAGRTLSTGTSDVFVLRDGVEHHVAAAMMTISHAPPAKGRAA